MKKQDTHRLNTHYLLSRIESLGVKQWWLARQLQVDRKTVGRWINGKVKRVARFNLEALARELNCDLADLILSDEADEHATREEQRSAAKILEERDLLSILAPSDDWVLAESLIKATMEPNLPLRSLGNLYNLLSVAAWRQGNYTEGEERARRALEIAMQTGDRGIEMKAMLNLGTIHSTVGPIQTSLAEFEACLARPEYFDRERDHGNTLSNVAWIYRESGDLDRCLKSQTAAIRIFERLELSYNLAISWISMGLYFTELRRDEDALEAIHTAREHAMKSKYERGQLCCDFYEADVYSARGEFDRARFLIERARPELDRYEVYDLTCLEITARFHRRAGGPLSARKEIDLALERAAKFPTILRATLLESVRIAQAAGEATRAEEDLRRANEIAAGQGWVHRDIQGTVPEYGTRRESS